ncbi:hypothetical protein NEMBOFW57_004271 [Staphylotrichum longicolle]|uniref:Uncharacterized protein n=1 Tax=Staphylotrichum longicolle TaxID=669026 RepID=A0AAD4F736_9PEZI|nr:hypothetical protein NEMBOFW57_004271 [Staphylotrichum longicolle]
MNRSRYVPHPAYAMSPYQPQPYGAIPPQSQIPGMMPTQPLSMPPSAYGNAPPNIGQSPIQTTLSPNALWAANFANGPIIEDLCAPPPPMGIPSASPPMSAFPPPRMAMAPMHPGAMPQVQNVYGIRPHAPHPFAPPGIQMHPGQAAAAAAQMQGMPAARVMGTYPPYTGQQHGIAYAPAPRTMDPSAALMGRPRLETGFPTPVGGGPGSGALGMGQMNSPGVGTVSDADGVPPLTPVEEALRGFLSPDLGDLGHP